MADLSDVMQSAAVPASVSVPASALVLLSTPLDNPRPSTAPQPLPPLTEPNDSVTPTRATFAGGAAGGLASQKPLPTSFSTKVHLPGPADATSQMRRRANSQHSRKSMDSEDVDMDGSDGDTAPGDDAAVSDEESVIAGGSRTGSKKKKSQRFYCTEYPPCSLSFTRSEHLARHIRKHTGERPFQCHCHRRFSRLDNLRQHAQTVHVNEDIPVDSLAASGSRLARPVRNVGTRQPPRLRAAGPRAHAKSLSTSNIGTIAFGPRIEDYRRPPPLVMAEHFPRSSLDHAYGPPSPTDFLTPSSATFSADHGSPRWGSGFASPVSTPQSHSHSRSHSMYAVHSRRLSVPSSGNPFASPQGIISVPGRVLGHYGASSSSSSAAVTHSPGLSTPTRTSMLDWPARRDSMESIADESWRRRTWHPDSQHLPNSVGQLVDATTPTRGLQPNLASKPPFATIPTDANRQGAVVSLPGIESFGPLLDDNQPGADTSSPRQHNSSSMLVDPEQPAVIRPLLLPRTQNVADEQQNRSSQQGDARLHRGFTKLDTTTPSSGNPMRPTDSAGQWANEAREAVLDRGERVRLGGANPLSVRFEQQLPTKATSPDASRVTHRHHHSLPASSITLPRERRQAWYHGPLPVHTRNHDDGTSVDNMIHPNMNDDTGALFSLRETQQSQGQTPRDLPSNDDAFPTAMDKLVAVATNAAY